MNYLAKTNKSFITDISNY